MRAPCRRGPFSFLVIRPGAKDKPGTDWLPGEVETDDVEDLATSLLTDPRDTIEEVYLWNERLNQFDSRTYQRGWAS